MWTKLKIIYDVCTFNVRNKSIVRWISTKPTQTTTTTPTTTSNSPVSTNTTSTSTATESTTTTTTTLLEPSTSPVKVYIDCVANKKNIFRDNKEKAGVYRFINLLNNKTYIGSSISLTARFRNYYQQKWMERSLARHHSNIYAAILIDGLKNFKLEILEYCDPKDVQDKEQDYMLELKPEYNICLAKSWSRGYILPENREWKVGNNTRSISVDITDLETGLTTNYSSCNSASKAIGCSDTAIRQRLHTLDLSPFRGRYIIKRKKR